ncbi:MAG: hypothetical protein IT473_11610 [Lysobacter sp.]|nr:hypothetical protein [Lysobacter sp.]
MSLFRWLTTPALATALAVAAFAPAPASARDDLIRVVVDLGDVVIRAGHPYYRHGGYGYDDRLIVDRDRYGRPIYYRYVPRAAQYRPPYGNAYGYSRYGDDRYTRRVCDSRGRCRVQYYDPRYDRYDDDDRYSYKGRGRHHDNRYDDRNDDRRGRGRGH